MGHKKIAVRLGLSLVAVAIVIPLASRVNHFIPQLPMPKTGLVADGPPVPPVPPPAKGNAFAPELLIADGPPVPPVPPPDVTAEVNAELFG